MRRAPLILFTLGILAAAVSCAHDANASAVYWIDYDHGNDTANGLTKRTAWKHLPGDRDAQGAAGKHTPGPGERFVLVAGSRYRGSVHFAFAGESNAPITISGETGGLPAVFDGSDPVQNVRPCANAAECGNASGWQRLTRISLAASTVSIPIVFTDTGPLHEAQSPNPQDAFYSDEITDFLTVDGKDLADGQFSVSPSVAATLAQSAGSRIVIWVRSNRVVERPLTSVSGVRVSFDPTGVDLYTDRPSRVAFRGGVGEIDQPGEFSLLPDGRTVVAWLPANAGRVSVGSGRSAIDVSGSRHVVIRDIAFERFADDGRSIRSGIGIFSQKPQDGLLVENNVFRDFVSRVGQGAMIIHDATHLVVRGNVIENMQFGSGMRIGSSKDVEIVRNRISHIGRTGIMLMNDSDVEVAFNHVNDVMGLHGNGMSAYLGNQNVRFVANTVYDAKQPVTFHGNKGDGPQATDLSFVRNLLIAPDTSLGSLISWGGSGVTGVRIVGNVVLGGAKTALRLSGADRSVVIKNNVAAGLVVNGDIPQDWTISGNAFTRAVKDALPGDNKQAHPVAIGTGGKVDPAAVCATISQDSSDMDRTMTRALGADLSCP
jgi:hypothetical protein